MIRNMRIEDIDNVVSDETRIFGESLGKQMLLDELTKNDMAHYFIDDSDDNKIISYIGLWADKEMQTAQILNFYVNEEYRRKGNAKKMLSYSIDYLYSLGVNTISLEVRPHNLDAIDLYESFGFQYSHKRKYYYSDGEDAYVLILRKD